MFDGMNRHLELHPKVLNTGLNRTLDLFGKPYFIFLKLSEKYFYRDGRLRFQKLFAKFNLEKKNNF